MDSTLEPETQSSTTGPKGRRTERIMLEIPIRVFSFGGRAGDFSEDTCTVMINRNGALIALKHRVAPDEIIRIINLENLREDDFRVVGLSRQEGEDYSEWGVECMDKNRSLWEIDFPPPMEINDSRGGALLQCQGCGRQSFLILSLTEVSILDSSGSFEKLCEKCGELKPWMYAEEVRPHKDSISSLETAPAMEPNHPRHRKPVVTDEQGERWLPVGGPPAPEAKDHPTSNAVAADGQGVGGLRPKAEFTPSPQRDQKIEKRLHRRLTLKLPALFRNSQGETEVARTENISKGGLGVGLTMKLTLAERVIVICPYSGSGQEIEQKAEVRRRVSLYGGERWFYGFRYVTE